MKLCGFGFFKSKQPSAALGILLVLLFASVPISMVWNPPGWDVVVYRNAIHSLEAGQDPYLDSIATLRKYYSQPLRPAGTPPYNYVYPPLTLLLLRFIGSLPVWFSGSLYWLAYLLGVLCEVWVGTLAFEEKERPYLRYLAPVAIYFPGLTANGTVLGGNIAYILYGTVLLAAMLGWRRGTWTWFYLAVLGASCFKAPMLSLVVVPLLSARRQWIPTFITAFVGVALFAATCPAWPDLFEHYLESLRLQLEYNRDFGSSPSGLLANALHNRGIPYRGASILFYFSYAVPTFAVLVHLSKRFLQGDFSLKQWLPVLLSGVVLLNPRVIEYDLAAITLLLALIAWRFFAAFTNPLQAIVCLAFFFIAANSIAMQSWELGKFTRGPLFVILFAAGCWNLLDSHCAQKAENLSLMLMKNVNPMTTRGEMS